MDWEHLSFFNSKANENPKFQPSNWGIKLDREINVGLFDTPGGSGCSGSELVHGSISRSSKSASISSSPNRDSKTCLFTFESSQDDSNGKIELSKEEQIETCYAPELSSVSGEPLLSLKLGKRMYFEDVCPESDSKNVDFSKDLVSSLSIGKKCKSNGQSSQCQVEGCGIDLSSAKDYHRKKRICESHAKSPKVVVAGLERRFCQQCSRFHALFEFDGKKRSCRQRLSHHNARRRKPRPPKDGQSSPSALTSSPCDDKQQMSPFAHSRTATNLAWQNIHNSKLPQTKDFHLEPAKDNIDIPSTVTMLFDDSKSINPGVEDFITFSDTNATQDFSCALSLLSTNLWDSYETKSIYPEPSNRSTSIAHAMSQHMPLDSSEYWHSDHDQQVNSSMWISNSNREDSNRFQEFQLFRRPYEFGFHQLD